MIKRELTMTVVCVCENQYGLWRPRCPACGTTNPTPKKDPWNAPRIAAPRRERQRRGDECIFCHRNKARERCAHCNEPIHKNCQGLHGESCKQFQVERAQALKEAGV